MIYRVIDAARSALDLTRDVLAALFPPELRRYVPGRKLIAGLVAYALVEIAGVPSEATVELPGLGVELDVEALAALVAVYVWPEEVPRRARRRGSA